MYNSTISGNFTAQGPGSDKADLVGIHDVALFLRRSYRMILASALGFAVLGLGFSLAVTPSFTATAQILIETNHIQSFFQDTSTRSEMETETGRIESQIEVIKSDRIAEATIRKLKLLQEAEFSPPAEPPFYAPVLEAIKRLLAPPEPAMSEEDLRTARMNLALEKFADRLSVRRVGQSFVAEVTFRSRDAARSALVTNTLLDAYINLDIEAKAENARRGNTWLTERLSELQTQVSKSRRDLEEFKASGESQSQSERAVKLAELDSVSQSQSRLYDVFLQRSIETAQKITYPVADARVIATASKPLSKSFPKTGLIVAFTGLLGAATGAGIALIRRSADHTIRSGQQLAAKLDCQILGTIAAMPRKVGSRTNGSPPVLAALVPSGQRHTRFAADFRSLKVAINTALLNRPCKRLGITSVGQGEGKTTVAGNLAALLACSGSRILLMDLCETNRSLGRTLVPDTTSGLAELIGQTDRPLRPGVPQDSIENLFVLPLGHTTGPASPAEQLALGRRTDIDAIGQEFDHLVLDLPGIDESPDTLAIAPVLNALIIVVEYGRTTIDDLESALGKLRGSRTEILGIVINKADPKAVAP